MNIRKLLSLMAVLACAVFSLPGIAAKPGGGGTDKSYSLVVQAQPEYVPSADVIPHSVVAPVKVQAFLKNEAPPSTSASNPGSWELLITNPGVTIFTDATHQPSGATNGVANGTAVATSPTRILITNMSPLKGQQVYVLTFYVTSCGDALWNANVNTGSSLNGDSFTRINDTIDPATGLPTNLQTLISCGALACGNSVTLVADEASQSPALVVTRGPYNSDGSCGATSDFFASNKLQTGNGQVHFRWPVGSGGQPLAAWAYNVVSTSSAPPKLAWLNSDGTKATQAITDKTPAYLDSATIPLQCQLTNGQAGVLPKPYGVVSNSANSNTTRIKVDTSSPNAVLPTPAAPFDIVIGTERMRVTSVQNSNWTVVRATGNTSADSHPTGAKVMSTPLPLLPTTAFQATLADGTLVNPAPFPYVTGQQAQMCIASGPTPVVPATNPPTWSTTIIDIGDAWVKIN